MKQLPQVKVHQAIYVPKLLVPLNIENLANKQLQERTGVDRQFYLKKRPFDPRLVFFGVTYVGAMLN